MKSFFLALLFAVCCVVPSVVYAQSDNDGCRFLEGLGIGQLKVCQDPLQHIQKGEFVYILAKMAYAYGYLDQEVQSIQEAMSLFVEQGFLRGESNVSSQLGADFVLNRATAITLLSRLHPALLTFPADESLPDLDVGDWYRDSARPRR